MKYQIYILKNQGAGLVQNAIVEKIEDTTPIAIDDVAGLQIALTTIDAAQTIANAVVLLNANNYSDGLVLQVIDNAPVDGNTIKKLNDKILAIQSIIGGTTADGDVIVDTVAELLAVFQTFPEGVDLVNLFAGKVSVSDVYNSLDCIIAGKVLDARQGKVLFDLINALTIAVDTKISGTFTTGTIPMAIGVNSLGASAITQSGGNVTVNGTMSASTFSTKSATLFVFKNTDNILRWELDRDSAETGSNTGSNLTLYRYDDAGAYLGTFLSLNRTSGNAFFEGTITASPATLSNEVVVKSQLDLKADISGITLQQATAFGKRDLVNGQNYQGTGAGGTGSNLNSFGTNAGSSSSGSNVNFFGNNAGATSTGSDTNALGANAAQTNSGGHLNAFGNGAGVRNSGAHLNAFGRNAGSDNSGSNVNILGDTAGNFNTFSSVNLFGAGANADAASQNVFSKDAAGLIMARLSYINLTASRKYELPNVSGTIALTDTTVQSGVNNATTVVLTSAQLNTIYPSASTGFRVYCTSIIAGSMVYEKTPTQWIGMTVFTP